mmetsp:Transcript_20471/g.38921  ORF Transcript_20471/g.38921 Transcript_20471/m.38921 type:complete len:243 (-) Transcript_20471:499-1227(-)
MHSTKPMQQLARQICHDWGHHEGALAVGADARFRLGLLLRRGVGGVPDARVRHPQRLGLGQGAWWEVDFANGDLSGVVEEVVESWIQQVSARRRENLLHRGGALQLGLVPQHDCGEVHARATALLLGDVALHACCCQSHLTRNLDVHIHGLPLGIACGFHDLHIISLKSNCHCPGANSGVVTIRRSLGVHIACPLVMPFCVYPACSLDPYSGSCCRWRRQCIQEFFQRRDSFPELLSWLILC